MLVLANPEYLSSADNKKSIYFDYRRKKLWSKGFNVQINIYVTFATKIKIGIGPVCHVWLFDTFRYYHNLHTLWYILFWYESSYEIDKNASEIKCCPYSYPIGWTHWALVGNTTMSTHLKKVQEKATDNSRIFFFFYQCFFFHYIRFWVHFLCSALDNVSQECGCKCF